MSFLKLSLAQKIERCREFSAPYRVADGKKFRLKDFDPDDTGELSSEDKPEAKEALAAAPGRVGHRAGPDLIRSAMPGVIVEVRAETGMVVKRGQVLLVLEAMKMQNEIQAERDGVVRAIHVAPGRSVPAGAPLVELGDPAADGGSGGESGGR